MAQTTGTLRIGTSGYQYDHWRGTFYPDDLPRSRWFDYYAERFDTVELNNTFYGLPKPATAAHWREAAPDGFLYAVKFSRYGSHVKRLREPESLLQRFLEPVRELGEHLGPILVQLPPRWKPRPQRLDAFLQAAPRDLRWAVELRDPGWLREEVYAVLAEHGAALCLHDMLPDHPWRLTASWTYVRYHGDHYAGGYSREQLAGDARRLNQWRAQGHDVYAYFNNDAEGHAVHDAATLRELMLA
ncbi:MAG TPA: DUF72 domain-containing protein [Gammaproteobacteria bacterium]|nr:DUF72 domain-containing protein [Gammaproteobacteria bacterium]